MDEIIRSSWHWLVLIGVSGGILSGTLGVGSGILFIPALVLVMSFPQKIAQGTCLAVIVPMALMGAIRYKMDPAIQINMMVVLLLAVSAVIGAFAGVEIASRLPGNVLRKIFACLIIIAALKMLFVPARGKQQTAVGDISIQITEKNNEGAIVK